MGGERGEREKEIKNPLAAIKGMTQSIDRNLNDPEFIADYREVVPKEIGRLSNLVDKLIRLGETPKPHAAPIDISGLLKDTIKIFENTCQKQGIKIATDFSPLPQIKADPEQLVQVFTNLILNAIQAMPKGGELKFKTQKSKFKNKESIIIEISDTGCGIAEEKLKHIFEPFFSTKEEGMGLGLAISYKIVKDHGGEIEVESGAGKGTKFRIILYPGKEEG